LVEEITALSECIQTRTPETIWFRGSAVLSYELKKIALKEWQQFACDACQDSENAAPIFNNFCKLQVQ